LVPALCGILVSLLMLGSGRGIIHGDDLFDHSSLDPLRAPMLESVGQIGKSRSGSVVYLGKGWILTANHAFVGRSSDVVIFSGQEYKLRAKGAVRLSNRSGPRSAARTDLVMVPLKTAPNLPDLKINEYMPFKGERVVMVGCGKTAKRDGRASDSGKGAVRPISGGTPGKATGPRWGVNEIADRNLQVGVPRGPGRTRTYATIRLPNRNLQNAQGAPGDSGGGVFVKRGNSWQLSGIMLSVVNSEDLDAGATFCADLSVYREQIESTIPEPSSLALLLVAVSCACLPRRRR
jgi:hypothetical protein